MNSYISNAWEVGTWEILYFTNESVRCLIFVDDWESGYFRVPSYIVPCSPPRYSPISYCKLNCNIGQSMIRSYVLYILYSWPKILRQPLLLAQMYNASIQFNTTFKVCESSIVFDNFGQIFNLPSSLATSNHIVPPSTTKYSSLNIPELYQAGRFLKIQREE